MRWMASLVLAVFMVGCGQTPGEPSPADKALEELRSLYERALEEAPEDPVGWAKEDLSRFGDWEYRIVEIEDDSPDALEQQLNELGTERWEAFWVERTAQGLRVYLKRPARSYLRSMPLSELGKAVSGAGTE